MGVTLLLTVAMMALLWLCIWTTTIFMPMSQLAGFFPEDIQERLKPRLKELDKRGMTGRRLVGWICFVANMLAMIGVCAYGGVDGMRRGYSYGQFLLRFLIIGLGVKAFDIICLDYVLLTKTRFFQRHFPETEGCAGWQQFGYNRKQQMRQIVMMIVFSFIMAGVFAWIGG